MGIEASLVLLFMDSFLLLPFTWLIFWITEAKSSFLLNMPTSQESDEDETDPLHVIWIIYFIYFFMVVIYFWLFAWTKQVFLWTLKTYLH